MKWSGMFDSENATEGLILASFTLMGIAIMLFIFSGSINPHLAEILSYVCAGGVIIGITVLAICRVAASMLSARISNKRGDE